MRLVTLFAATAIAVTSTVSAIAEELKFANFTPPFHTINASVIEKLNETLSAATNGGLTVRGYHGGELGKGPVEQYVRVVQGAADIAWGLPGYTSSQFGKTMVVEMPNAIPLEMKGYEALWRAYNDHLAGEFPGTKPLALWTSEPNILIMKDKQIRTPADLAGLKIRVAGATAAEVAEALGATPVQMPINEVYNSLQTGLIDGVITGASTLSDFKLDEVASSYTVGGNFGRLAFYTVMSEAKYNSLPDDQKKAIDEASGMALSESAETAWNAAADAALKAARESGDNTVIDLSEAEIKAFSDAVSAVTQKYVDSVDGASTLASMQGK